VARTLTDGETVVDDSAYLEELTRPTEYQRSGANVVQLLFRVSEDATRRNAYVHRGCACNSCSVVPIRGIRYRCANCADYDLCEGCESQGLHTKTHIFYKIRVPAPSFAPRHIQPVWYSGDPDSVMRVLPKEITTKLSRETGFERPELDAYWEQWTFMANTEWRDDPHDINLAMDRKTFERCLVPSGGYRHAAPSLIFDRMFAFYDMNKDDLISFPEFLHGIAFRKKKDKWIKIFEGYDIDGDGYVDRKDFLRMFRSYYVLYRQMHRDMLEGMEEQQMSTTEAHRLVNSRQPLSSAFGQDGRYPRAPDPRTGEGKTAQPGGDLEITDGKGVMNESSTDTGNREDIFRRDVPRTSRNYWEQERERSGSGYWDAILNPPETVEQMPEVLRTLQRVRSQVADILHDDSNAHPALFAARHMEENHDSSDDSDGDSGPESDQAWPPTFVTVTDEDAEAVDGPGTRVADVRRSSRRAVISHAVYRERAHREMYERWQRRHFYTDEEEGATPPADWKDDDDVLAQNGMAGESSKAPTRPIVHSRSSSKVRFAEDMDDFDTRSNPSTSSRSVPERWGGIEIPDAERDAGKEILYQVTQQAFNELLDPLFKEKEDMAVEAAAHKADREKYRSLYSTPEFETWALDKKFKEIEETHKREKRERMVTRTISPGREWTHFPAAVEIEEVRVQPLEELLASTGYRVDDLQNEMPEFIALPSSEETRPDVPDHAPVSEGSDSQEADSNLRPHNPPPASPTEVLSIIAQYDDDRDPASPQSTPPQATPPASNSDAGDAEYRDPTFPQFRPDSDTSQDQPTSRRRYGVYLPEPDEENGEYQNSPPPEMEASVPLNEKSKTQEEKPDQAQLYKLWKMDRAAKEADGQGGWGRLSFEEFQGKVKKFVGEGKGNQMDYLGSWIEFCIP
jgi:Ca2+-binding EF-hand superfamily protein